MNRTSSTRLAACLSAAVLASAGLTLASDYAFAQQTEEITVSPPSSGYRLERRTRHRIHITQWVGHADLDLRTDQGAQALGARIGAAAEENCKLLDRYYPDSVTPAAKVGRKQNCVTDAVYGAQPQFQAVVYAARR